MSESECYENWTEEDDLMCKASVFFQYIRDPFLWWWSQIDHNISKSGKRVLKNYR